MNITIVGTGYVGLVTGTCFSSFGNNVWCVDIDKVKIENLKKGILPIYEPGLESMIEEGVAKKRLRFTTDYAEAVSNADICFILILNIFPDFVIKLLFGEKYINSIQYLFPVSIMTFTVGALTVIVNFLLALNRVKLLICGLVVGGFLYIILALTFHRSIFQILFILTSLQLVLLLRT